MWIFLSDAFLSVVADRDEPQGERLLVRARREGDIEHVFPEADVTTTPALCLNKLLPLLLVAW